AVAPGTTDPASRIFELKVHRSEGTLHERGDLFHLVKVMDLAGPEHFYHDVLGMELLARTRMSDGRLVELGADYDHATAAQTNTEADFAFLAHGPVKLALQRTGRASILDYGKIVNDFALVVEPSLAKRIKAQVLMRGFTLLEEKPASFTLRDPYAVAWEIVPAVG
ncbi:MAG TPA: hypothetical protein VFQ54_09045, partial [Thermomicrobiales bacterium]|nr:hypothetical protein [Thermomicrobiales bacterium]